jgi:hypothetical protein
MTETATALPPSGRDASPFLSVATRDGGSIGSGGYALKAAWHTADPLGGRKKAALAEAADDDVCPDAVWQPTPTTTGPSPAPAPDTERGRGASSEQTNARNE